jgi:thymidylate synthase
VALIAPHLEMTTVRDGYVDLVELVRQEGSEVRPRDLPCLEVTGATLVVHDPVNWAMPLRLGRGLNPAIGAVEALQLIGGVSTPALLTKVAPNFRNFMDGEAFFGAYGPRLAAQLPEVRRQLKVDPDTRQAVAAIWRVDDLWAHTRDLPCTTSMQFLLRDGALQLHVTMRSNDVWWGWSYDAFQFTRLQVAMADSLGVGVGPYVHRAGSLHLYERDLAAADDLAPDAVSELDWHAPRFDLSCEPWDVYQGEARALLAGGVVSEDANQWYRKTLDAALDKGRLA